MSRAGLACVLAALLPMAACADSLPTVAATIGGERFRLEIAATGEEKRTGLMHRESLAADAGMIFVYPRMARRAFHMKNTRIDLDLLCVKDDGELARVHRMPAEAPRAPDESGLAYERRLKHYACPRVLYIIEVPMGTAGRLGLEPGAVLDLPHARLRDVLDKAHGR